MCRNDRLALFNFVLCALHGERAKKAATNRRQKYTQHRQTNTHSPKLKQYYRNDSKNNGNDDDKNEEEEKQRARKRKHNERHAMREGSLPLPLSVINKLVKLFLLTIKRGTIKIIKSSQ